MRGGAFPWLAARAASVLLASPASAITYGQPDDGEQRYVRFSADCSRRVDIRDGYLFLDDHVAVPAA